MIKFYKLVLAAIISSLLIFSLSSCLDMFNFVNSDECEDHKDENSNLRCDICGEKLTCDSHKDENHNQKCDYCGSNLPCSHFDEDGNGVCDWCEFCMSHVDENHDLCCDRANCEAHVPCVNHNVVKDDNGENYCLWCNAKIVCYPDHIDENGDGYCDKCTDDCHTVHVSNDDDCKCDFDGCQKFAPHVDKNEDSHCDKCGIYISSGVIGPVDKWD